MKENLFDIAGLVVSIVKQSHFFGKTKSFIDWIICALVGFFKNKIYSCNCVFKSKFSF